MNDKDNEDRALPFSEIKSTPRSQLQLRTRLNKLFFQSHVSLGNYLDTFKTLTSKYFFSIKLSSWQRTIFLPNTIGLDQQGVLFSTQNLSLGILARPKKRDESTSYLKNLVTPRVYSNKRDRCVQCTTDGPLKLDLGTLNLNIAADDNVCIGKSSRCKACYPCHHCHCLRRRHCHRKLHSSKKKQDTNDCIDNKVKGDLDDRYVNLHKADETRFKKNGKCKCESKKKLQQNEQQSFFLAGLKFDERQSGRSNWNSERLNREKNHLSEIQKYQNAMKRSEFDFADSSFSHLHSRGNNEHRNRCTRHVYQSQPKQCNLVQKTEFNRIVFVKTPVLTHWLREEPTNNQLQDIKRRLDQEMQQFREQKSPPRFTIPSSSSNIFSHCLDSDEESSKPQLKSKPLRLQAKKDHFEKVDDVDEERENFDLAGARKVLSIDSGVLTDFSQRKRNRNLTDEEETDIALSDCESDDSLNRGVERAVRRFEEELIRCERRIKAGMNENRSVDESSEIKEDAEFWGADESPPPSAGISNIFRNLSRFECNSSSEDTESPF